MIAQIDKEYIMTNPWKVYSRILSYTFFEGRPLTTRGRWINPIVFRIFALENMLPQLKSVTKPIFIIGTGRSGSTILGVVLSMHRDVGFLNEPKALWHFVYPFEDIIGSYSLGDSYYKLNEDNLDEPIINRAHKIYGAYLAVVFVNRVVDKYPELVFRIPFIKGIFPDAKFIFLVRNGWDTCQSISNWSKRRSIYLNEDIHDWWGLNDRKWQNFVEQVVKKDPFLQNVYQEIRFLKSHTQRAAVEWIASMREGYKQMNNYPSDIYLLRYEELCKNPFKELGYLSEFCELSHDDKIIKYGTSVLRPTTPREPFVLDEALQFKFNETMKMAGYVAT